MFKLSLLTWILNYHMSAENWTEFLFTGEYLHAPLVFVWIIYRKINSVAILVVPCNNALRTIVPSKGWSPSHYISVWRYFVLIWQLCLQQPDMIYIYIYIYIYIPRQVRIGWRRANLWSIEGETEQKQKWDGRKKQRFCNYTPSL